MPEPPYYERLFDAVVRNDHEELDAIINECFATMTHKFMDIVKQYDWNDLPIVVTVMKVAARTLEMTLDENGKRFVDSISSRTESIAIDLDELRRQAREEDREE